MNCDEFSRRMHQRLDRRQSLGGDGQLSRHARQCESCRAQLDAWREIAAVIPTAVTPAPAPTGGLRGPGTLITAAASLAAAIMLVFIVIRDESQSNRPTVVVSDDQRSEAVLAQSGSQLDPSFWWRSVQDRDWVGQTMPTVKSVQEGVAPIGRSLIRAVTILTIGGHDQTS